MIGLRLATWEPDTTRRFVEVSQTARDPVLAAAHADAPFVVAADVEALAGAHADGQAALGAFHRLGLVTPTIIPVRDPLGPIGCIGFAGGGRADDALVDRMLGFAAHLHAAVRRADDAAAIRVGGLSRRELECLAWVAQGKTAWEVAMILGVGERTVVAHLTSAMSRLDAVSRFHAVAIAMRAGLVT